MKVKNSFTGEEDKAQMDDSPSSPPPPMGAENILVSVRLRPLGKFDGDEEEEEEDAEIENNGRFTDWECINDNTIIFKRSMPERSMYPAAYTFDRVFECEASTDEVYEEVAKEVALASLSGLNATVFAYGQTGSGKTYTMRGITDRAVSDIYSYINKRPERVFVMKLSAIEIYNEVVRDLLASDNTPLRLMDDPERGTVVERLVEENLQDMNHLQKLLGICEANRQVGETMLNETSSRSHQIVKLTIESCVRDEAVAADMASSSSILATLNFVDLAGSERASQSLSAGTRLKEGCHINRSLLTLGTVIRKLSGSNKVRNGHIPYRDSKLTRILQHSLGGNARTAIICTMSPARRHVEQSRNTLFFASCAKEVATSAHVNVVMSDKVLVKHLQKEVARLETELQVSARPPSSISTEALLREKDLKMRKMEQEIKELTQQRNYAQNQFEDLLQSIGSEQPSRGWMEQEIKELTQQRNYAQSQLKELLQRIGSVQPSKGWDSLNGIHTSAPRIPIHTLSQRMDSYREVEYPASEVSGTGYELVSDELSFPVNQDHSNEEENQTISGDHSSQRAEEVEQESFIGSDEFQQFSGSTPKKQPDKEFVLSPLTLVHEIRKLEHLQEELGKDACRALETLQKEVQFLHIAQSGPNKDAASTMTDLRDEIQSLHSKDENLRPPEPSALRSIDASTFKEEISRLNGLGDFSKLTDTDATIASLEQQLQIVEDSIENLVFPMPTESLASPLMRTLSDMTVSPQLKRSSSCQAGIMCSWAVNAFEDNENTPLRASRMNSFVDVKRVHGMFKTAAQENIGSIRAYVTELKERVAKLQYQKQLLVCQVMELEKNGNVPDDGRIKRLTLSDSPKHVKSPSSWPLDFNNQRMQIIELWASCCVSIIHRSHFFLLFKGDPADAMYMEVELRRLSFLKKSFSQKNLKNCSSEDDQTTSLASNIQALRREREMLVKQMQRKLTAEERGNLFEDWGIALNTKQRKLQLAQKLWANTQDMDNIQTCANLVAKLVGFWKPGEVSKEMFELNFSPQKNNQRPSGWNHISILFSF